MYPTGLIIQKDSRRLRFYTRNSGGTMAERTVREVDILLEEIDASKRTPCSQSLAAKTQVSFRPQARRHSSGRLTPSASPSPPYPPRTLRCTNGLGRENSPRRLCLWNTKKDHSICEVNFLTAVLAVKLNRKRVAVCLKNALHVFDISDMKCLRTLETAPNPDGVMALSPNEENCHLAFPDGAKGGSSGGGGEVRLHFFSRA